LSPADRFDRGRRLDAELPEVGIGGLAVDERRDAGAKDVPLVHRCRKAERERRTLGGQRNVDRAPERGPCPAQVEPRAFLDDPARLHAGLGVRLQEQAHDPVVAVSHRPPIDVEHVAELHPPAALFGDDHEVGLQPPDAAFSRDALDVPLPARPPGHVPLVLGEIDAGPLEDRLQLGVLRCRNQSGNAEQHGPSRERVGPIASQHGIT
jgi:hypothetical protein